MKSFKTYSLLIVCIILIPDVTYAGWWRTYGTEEGESATCVQLTDDGNFIISGTYLLKVDNEGSLLWKSDLNGSCVAQTFDRGYILSYYAGFDHSGLTKTDEEGNISWERTYAYPFAFGGLVHVEQCIDGGYISIGTTSEDVEWVSGAIVLKTDALGDEEWRWNYEYPDYNSGECVQQTSDSGYIALEIMAGDPYTFLRKFPSDYNYSSLMYPSSYRVGWGSFVRQTTDDGYIVTGYSWSGGFIMKVSSTFDSLWTKTYEGTSGECVQLTDDGGYIVAGSKNRDVYLLKTDSLGNVGDIPLNISPVLVWAPERMQNTGTITPYALFENISTEDFAGNFFCHCEITDLTAGVLCYHDSVEVTGGLLILESRTIEFSKWSTDDISEFQALFYTAGEFESDSMTVDFRLTGIDEEPEDPDFPVEWKLVEPFGPEIILRYPDLTETVLISLFDPSGRRVDETEVSGSSGTVTWARASRPGCISSMFHPGKSRVPTRWY